MTKGDIIPINVMGRRIDLVVISTNPSGPVIINNSTEIIVSEERTQKLLKLQKEVVGKMHHQSPMKILVD